MVTAPRSSRWPVVALLSRSSVSRRRGAWALTIPKPTSLASAPMSATWLCRRSSSSRSARTRRSCSATSMPAACFDRHGVGEGVADGGVPADALGELDAVGGAAAFEELLDSSVDEPEPGLHPQDGLADDREPEVPGLDDSGVDGPDRDLVDALPLDLEERERPDVRARTAAGPASRRIGYQPRGQCPCRTSRPGSGWPIGVMPYRSRISRSKRPAA